MLCKVPYFEGITVPPPLYMYIMHAHTCKHPHMFVCDSVRTYIAWIIDSACEPFVNLKMCICVYVYVLGLCHSGTGDMLFTNRLVVCATVYVCMHTYVCNCVYMFVC